MSVSAVSNALVRVTNIPVKYSLLSAA